jgi:hypothetical protein
VGVAQIRIADVTLRGAAACFADLCGDCASICVNDDRHETLWAVDHQP